VFNLSKEEEGIVLFFLFRSSLIFKEKILFFIESLILAQDERWRRGLGMQVKGARKGNRRTR